LYGLVDVAPFSTNKDKNKNKTKNEYIPHDPDAWFKDYEPELQTKFKATKPSMPAYALDPDEMDAKYEVVPKHDDAPASCMDILEMALSRKKLREQMDGFLSPWTDQQLVDYACLEDPNRRCEVDPESLRYEGGETLLEVEVESYILPDRRTIQDAISIKSELEEHNVLIECNWAWLQKEVTPDVRRNIHEAVFGLSVVKGIGLDNTDETVAKRDVESMVAFHGVKGLERNFVSPPVSHKLISLPLNDFGDVALGQADMELLTNHARETRQFEKYVASLGITKPPPPLPRARYQISRLKWIPTEAPTASDATKYKTGYFQGAYLVPGTTWFSTVSLKDDWVINEFDKHLLHRIREQGVDGLRKRAKFIPIPPGNSKKETLPPAPLLQHIRRSQFQQGKNSTCLVDSFSSAALDFGCKEQVQQLRQAPQHQLLTQCNTTVWDDFGKLVNVCFRDVGLKLFRNTSLRSVDSLLSCDDGFVIIASIKASNGMEGQHAVAIYNGGIYDANCSLVMKKSQESLDWCCGDGSVTCTGIVRSYQLLPTLHRATEVGLRYAVVQTRNAGDCNVRGWVGSIKKTGTIRVQFVDGTSTYVTRDEFAMLTRLN
jgi:hypothetical protein